MVSTRFAQCHGESLCFDNTHQVEPYREPCIPIPVNILFSHFIYLLPEGGGGFPLTNGIRGCSKFLRCIFLSFGISMCGLLVTYPMRPICKIGCILENLAKKAPNLPQIGCFLQKNGIEMGHKITLFEV